MALVRGFFMCLRGVEWQGWVDFSKQCKGFWDSNVRRRAAVGGVGNNKGKEILLPQTTQKDINFKNQISVDANKAISINATLQPPETKVKAGVEVSIQLELICGPIGVWEVAQAQVV